jgi:hypothetical protein
MKIENEINRIYVLNAVKEMREIGKRALNYAEELEKTTLDVEQEALIKNFEDEFNFSFSEIIIKK